jgi:signal transduction histidine kinase
MGRSRALALLLGGVLALAGLAVLSLAVVQSQERARDDAFERFADRGRIAAQLLAGSMNQSSTRQAADAQLRLSGRVTPAVLRAWEGESGPAIPYTALFDPRGRLLAANPASARPAASDSGRMALRGAIRGRFTTSDVTSSARGPVIETFVPFPAGRKGLRVLVIAFPRELTAEFATGGLRGAAGTPGGSAFLTDRAGSMIAAVGKGDRDAVRAAVRRGRSSGRLGDERLVVRPVGDSALLVALTAPEDELTADLPSATLPRLTLAGFGLALLVVFWLIARAIRDARRVEAARHAAERANRAKTAFVGWVSHELRTPVSVISGATRFLATDNGVDPQARALIGDIDASAGHLTTLLTDLIDISAIEQGRLRLAPAEVDVAALCGEVAGAVRPLAGDRGLTIDVACDAELDTVCTDPSRLRQALYNYLHNAVKFAPSGGRVTVTAAPDGMDRFRIEVANAGPHISPADQERLFTGFEQLDPTQTGSGLGLAVTRHVIEAQGGRVGVRSAAGELTRFWLWLPVRPVGP